MNVSDVGLESLRPFWYGLVEIGVGLFIETIAFELDSVETIPEKSTNSKALWVQQMTLKVVLQRV